MRCRPETIMLPLATNPRAKMQGLRRRLREAVRRPGTGVSSAGSWSRRGASELILPIAMAVQNGLTVDRTWRTRSRSTRRSPGSIAEAGRQLMRHGDLD